MNIKRYYVDEETGKVRNKPTSNWCQILVTESDFQTVCQQCDELVTALRDLVDEVGAIIVIETDSAMQAKLANARAALAKAQS